MSKRLSLTRRAILCVGASAAGAVATGATAAMKPTPPNPEGPFYPVHEQADRDADLTRVKGREGQAEGQVIKVAGQVLDEDGQPVADAVVDIWQANAFGRYDHEGDTSDSPLDPNFQSWAIMKTDAEGRYAFKTIKPGAYTAMGDWVRPPHIHFKVSRRGYHELTTQMYFAGEPLNDSDALFQDVPENERERLLVSFDDSGDAPRGTFDIVLRRVNAA